MPCMFDVTKLFDQEAFSDIAVKFGNQEKKCHKLASICMTESMSTQLTCRKILASNSEYFDGLFKRGKAFSELQQGTIELKDDDEEAVNAMLRWLYTFDYEEHRVGPAPQAGASFHLSVVVVADKYQILPLRDEALSRLRKALELLSDDEFAETFRKVWYEGRSYPDSLTVVIEEVRTMRLRSLLSNEAFRILMWDDVKLCLDIIDILRGEGKGGDRGDAQAGVSADPSTTTTVVVPPGTVLTKKFMVTCSSCQHESIKEPFTYGQVKCEWRRGNCPHYFTEADVRYMWIAE